MADDGNWTVYPAFHNASRAVALGSRVFVLSDGGMFAYDTEDTSVEIFSTANKLNDFNIHDIRLCSNDKLIFILYTNGNIDLMKEDGSVYNITDIKDKTLSDKTINDLNIVGSYAYISINSGLIVVDIANRLINNYYALGMKVNSTTMANNTIYAATSEGVYAGKTSDNLLDISNWKNIATNKLKKLITFNNSIYTETGSGLYKVSNSENFKLTKLNSTVYNSWDETNGMIFLSDGNNVSSIDSKDNIVDYTNDTVLSVTYANGKYWLAQAGRGLVGTTLADKKFTTKVAGIIPESPIRNYASFLRMADDRLLIAGGSFNFSALYYPGTLMKYENNKFTAFDEAGPIKEVGEFCYRNLTDIAQDPNDTEHHFAGSAMNGIYEFKNYKLVKHYNHTNSTLSSILPESTYPERYVRTTGLEFDQSGNLWMLNNEVDTIIKIRKSNGSWTSLYFEEMAGNPSMDKILFDKRGWAWVNSRRRTSSGCLAGAFVIKTDGTIPSTADGMKRRLLTNIVNQDGTYYNIDLMKDITEDLDGNIWFATDKGVFVTYAPDQVFDSDDFRFYQVIIPRNDGSGLGDYLLTGVDINCITIDGGNRKWIGTSSNGVYLVSANGEEELLHFTTKDSPLISDNVTSIAVDGKTGMVYFGSAEGLVSYLGDATDPADDMKRDNIKVYPNPVRPDYTGKISITGLAYNSNVKIVNAAGRLICEGTSNGGQFTWNGMNSAGKQCGSGVYYVLATDSEGNKGAAQKFVIVRR
jgi:hypothetical protein